MTEQEEIEYLKRENELLREILEMKKKMDKLQWPKRTLGIDRDVFGGCSFS